MAQTPHEKFFRKELVKELRRVEKLVRKEESIEKKAYYFSAAYGITGRTFRYSFSEDVLLADFVLNTAYNLLMERINRLKTGDQTVPLTEETFNRLCEGLRMLADRFEHYEDIQEPLELIITAAFTTTGPGNYLLEKGEIKF